MKGLNKILWIFGKFSGFGEFVKFLAKSPTIFKPCSPLNLSRKYTNRRWRKLNNKKTDIKIVHNVRKVSDTHIHAFRAIYNFSFVPRKKNVIHSFSRVKMTDMNNNKQIKTGK